VIGGVWANGGGVNSDKALRCPAFEKPTVVVRQTSVRSKGKGKEAEKKTL
jgi:hypothetical protein